MIVIEPSINTVNSPGRLQCATHFFGTSNVGDVHLLFHTGSTMFLWESCCNRTILDTIVRYAGQYEVN